MIRKRILLALLALSLPLLALNTTLAADRVLLVGGLGGGEKYEKEFLESLVKIRSLLKDKHGYEGKNIRLLAHSKTSALSADSPTSSSLPMDALSTLENLEGEFKRLGAAMQPSDTLLLILIGHGQSNYREPKFNLPGPDLTARALGAMLKRLPSKDQRLILTFACSGHFSEVLSDPLRTIIASCDGPRQIYHTVAAPLLANALAGDDADVNLDGEISFLEIFEFLSEKVEDHFIEGGMLQTENPSLDDNGDGRLTTLAEGMDAGDGENADTVRISPAPSLTN